MQVIPLHEQVAADDGSIWMIFRVHGPGEHWTGIISRVTPEPAKDPIYRTPSRAVWYGSRLTAETVMTEPLEWIENYTREPLFTSTTS